MRIFHVSVKSVNNSYENYHMKISVQQLIEHIQAHPEWDDRRLAKSRHRQGVTTQDVRDARAAMKSKLVGPPPTLITKPGSSFGQPLSGLVDQFDDVAKIKKAMRDLAKDSYADDDEMRRTCHISFDRWKDVSGHAAVAKFRFILPNKKSVWMHPEAQVKLTKAITLDQQ